MYLLLGRKGVAPDGQSVNYESDNVILEDLTKEAIVEKRLFPYIPFYIARYEEDMISGNNIDRVADDLIYFREELLRLNRAEELSDAELIDLMGFVNTIITHITNGNRSEERLVNVMGGMVLETESEKWFHRGMSQGISQGMSQGQAKMIVELGQEDGLDDAAIIKKCRIRSACPWKRQKAI